MNTNSLLQGSTAVCDQSVSKGPTGRGKTWKIVQKAMGMGCPYLENLEESVVKEILFSDGEARFRTLQWFVGRFHPKLQEMLFSSGTSATTVPTLTSLLSDAGVCSRVDYELVKGSTSVAKQVKFLEALLDVVELGGWDSSELYSPHDRLPRQMETSCNFMDQLCRSEDLGVIFPTSLSLIPPGIAKATAMEGSMLSEKKQCTALPSSSELAGRLREMTERLETCQAELDQLIQSHTFEQLDLVAIENTEKSLLVGLETLSQLSTDFCHMYESEIEAWTDRQPPELTPLGACLKRVNTHRQQVEKLVQSIDLLQTTLQSLQSLKATTNNHGDTLLKAREAIKKCLEVIGG